MVERRRKQLGIDPKKPPVKAADFSGLRMFSMPEPDEATVKAAEAHRAFLDSKAEAGRRRAFWRDLCADECEAYAEVTVDSYQLSEDAKIAAQQRELLASVARYIDSLPDRVRSGDGFLFYGPCGTGKDHLAMAICRAAVLDYGFTVERINGPEWYGRLRDFMNQESASEAREVRRLASCDLLLISDPVPPMGDLTQYQASMLYRVLEKRQANYRATIITANIEGPADAAKRMGAATMERMKHNAWTFACNWPSFRKSFQSGE